MTIIKLSSFASLCLLFYFFLLQCFAAPQARLEFFLPPSLPTCMPVQMQWSNAIGPKANITIFTFDTKNSLPNSKPDRQFLNLDADKGSHIWRIDLKSNQNVLIRLTDSAHRSIDSTIKITRSVASEPPCKIEGQSVKQSIFEQMSFKGPIGVEPPRLINSVPKDFVPAKVVNGTVIAQYNTPMFLNSSSPVPVVPVVMPKVVGKINDSAPVMVVDPNDSSKGIILPARPAHNDSETISFNFQLFCSILISAMIFTLFI